MKKVSVIMPVYNAEGFIKETVDSILNQTFQNFELIIVDDCSTDGSRRIIESIKDIRIRYYRNIENRGIAYTRNRALSLADAEYIAIMDDDDIAPPYRLEDSVCYMDRHLDIDVFGGNTCIIDENGNDIGCFPPAIRNYKLMQATLIFQNVFGNSTAMIRKSLIDKFSIRYEENMYGAEDYRFWAQCSKHGRIAAGNKTMLYWRKHSNATQYMNQNCKKDREDAIFLIQNDLLTYYGFELSKMQKNMFCDIFSEDGKFNNMEDMKKVYNLLRDLIDQAFRLNLDFKEEFKMACRKQFGKKCSTAFFLWNV